MSVNGRRVGRLKIVLRVCLSLVVSTILSEGVSAGDTLRIGENQIAEEQTFELRPGDTVKGPNGLLLEHLGYGHKVGHPNGPSPFSFFELKLSDGAESTTLQFKTPVTAPIREAWKVWEFVVTKCAADGPPHSQDVPVEMSLRRKESRPAKKKARNDDPSDRLLVEAILAVFCELNAESKRVPPAGGSSLEPLQQHLMRRASLTVASTTVSGSEEQRQFYESLEIADRRVSGGVFLALEKRSLGRRGVRRALKRLGLNSPNVTPRIDLLSLKSPCALLGAERQQLFWLLGDERLDRTR